MAPTNLLPAPYPTERPSSQLTLQLTLAAVRSDLADTTSSSYRWQDADLRRAVDRALEDYSRVSPHLVGLQIPTIKGSRLYPQPDGCWWTERVEYPLGYWPKRYVTFQERTSPLIAPPPAGMTVAVAAGGSLTGAYQWATTFLVPGGGETTPSPLVSQTVANATVTLAGIPTGPYGVCDRNLYRTLAGGSTLHLITNLGDNTTTSYVDVTPDGGLGVAIPPTQNGTDGIPQLELDLDPASLPADGTGFLELLSAYKHELDALGTTVPEKHWDVLTLGGEAYALFQYLTTTNDNLDYVDGQFRDRVDDTKAPLAWQAQYDTAWAKYQARLLEVKNEVTHIAQPLPQWGDKPIRWDRL